MAYTVLIKEEARADMLESRLYYEEAQQGPGERFLGTVQGRFDDLTVHPEYYSYIDDKQELRDVKVPGFPFVIIFEIIGSDVIVYAVHLTHKFPRKEYRP